MIDKALRRTLIVEFLGSFALVFFVVGAVATEYSNLVIVALAHGLALTAMIAISDGLTSGYFNPAITIGLAVAGKLDIQIAVKLVVAQILGAAAASITLIGVLADGSRYEVQNGLPVINKSVVAGSDVFSLSTANGLLAEAIGTFFLTLVILGAVVGKRASAPVVGFAAGMIALVSVLALGDVSNAALNPVLFIGPAIVDGTADDFLVWTVGPVVGAILATLLSVRVLWPEFPAGLPLPDA